MELLLEPMGVEEIDADAAHRVRGGGDFWKDVALWVIESATENWEEIKQGYQDGLSGTYDPPSQR